MIRCACPGRSLLQVHLAVTGDPSKMVVMWVTQLHIDNGTSPFVQFGSSSGQYGAPVYGTSATYTIPPRCARMLQIAVQRFFHFGYTLAVGGVSSLA